MLINAPLLLLAPCENHMLPSNWVDQLARPYTRMRFLHEQEALWGIHYLFDTSSVYTIVKITLQQNYIQLFVS